MKNPVMVFFVMLCVVSSVFSTTILRGEISDLVCDRSGNPFIVDSTITIPKHGKIVFKEGCIVLVKPFCGIEVAGNFIVKGTLKNPVVFTTINDNHFNPKSEQFPQPLDWNGIVFHLTSDTVVMEHFKLMYSVYGIKSWNSRIVVHGGIFGENGLYNMVVNDALQPVTPGVSYSFNYTPPSEDTLNFREKVRIYEQMVHKRKVLTIITFNGGLLGAALDGYFLYRYIDLRNNRIPDFDFRSRPYSEFEKLKDKRDAYKVAAIAATSCSGVLLASSLALFLAPVRVAPAKNATIKASAEICPASLQAGIKLLVPINQAVPYEPRYF